MKNVYKMIFDNGKIFYVRAKSRTKAIEWYCTEYGICEEWVKAHCKIVNMGGSEIMKKRIMEILSVPIHPHELADPTEAVADYLLDNDVVPVVRCKNCTYRHDSCFAGNGNIYCDRKHTYFPLEGFCSYGERREGE